MKRGYYIYIYIIKFFFPFLSPCCSVADHVTTLTTPCHWGRSVGLITMVETAWGAAMRSNLVIQILTIKGGHHHSAVALFLWVYRKFSLRF